jgi:hypothetical protein
MRKARGNEQLPTLPERADLYREDVLADPQAKRRTVVKFVISRLLCLICGLLWLAQTRHHSKFTQSAIASSMDLVALWQQH